MYDARTPKTIDPERARWGLRAHLLVYVAANLVQVLIWWQTTPDQFFWPIYSIVGWAAGLALHAWIVRSLDTHAPDTAR